MPAAPRQYSLLVKPASADCNLHCQYCFYHDRPTDPYGERPRHRMDGQVLDALIKQGMRLNRESAVFGWQGGEPTLCGLDFFKRVVELQQKYGAPGQVVSNGLQTNALLLTPEWAEFLHQYNFLLGVSLDGPAEYHDRYRTYASGAPTHARVIEAARMLSAHDVEFNILTVVNRHNADHGAEVYDYLVSQGFRYLQFIPCVEVDPQTGRLADFSVTPEQFARFTCTVFDRWYNGGRPEVSVRDFEAILAVYLGQEATMCCYQEQCGDYVVVEYNGDVYPCDFFVQQDLHIGNIMQMPLEQIFASKALRGFALAKAQPRPECLRCPWNTLCNQGCPRFLGIEGSTRHYLCRAYQQFFTYSHDRFIQLRDQILLANGLEPRQARRIPAQPIGRNDPCPCGSGRKYKACCAQRGYAL